MKYCVVSMWLTYSSDLKGVYIVYEVLCCEHVAHLTVVTQRACGPT